MSTYEKDVYLSSKDLLSRVWIHMDGELVITIVAEDASIGVSIHKQRIK